MRFIVMFVTAVCVLFLIKLRWPKKNNFYDEFKFWARFLKAPETFWARKLIFCSSVSKNREVYTPETSGMKRTSVHIMNMVNETAQCNRGGSRGRVQGCVTSTPEMKPSSYSLLKFVYLTDQ